MLSNKNLSCIHCGNKTTEEFCCQGCETAYKIINKMGLSNYYESRIIDEKTRKIKPENFEKIENINDFIKQENGENVIFLAIDGLHCAACVWLIESILQKQENVILARINLSRKYLKLKWRGQGEEAKSQIKNYIETINEIGYKLFPFDELILEESEKKYNNDLIKYLALAGFGAGNVMLFSSILWFSDLNALGHATIDLIHFASALIVLPIIVYSARPFLYSAIKSIKSGYLNMDVTIASAIILICIVSLIESFKGATHVYFDSAIMLIFFLLIGKYLDFRARKQAFDIAKEFSLLSANFARVVKDDNQIEIISTKNIKKDMILLVVAGDKIPADAIVIEGESEIDNAIISGESLPKQISKNSEIYAGATNLNAPIKIKVLKDYENSLLQEIVKITENTESQKNKYIKIADKLAIYYTPAVHILAAATFSLWYFYFKTSFENSLLNAIAVLIITCPCALALAVPIAQTITISNFIKRGILIKSGDALEKLKDIDVIIFDKTGTLTIGKPQLIDIIGLSRNLTEEEKNTYLKLASSLAAYSSHPISKSLADSYFGQKIALEVTEEKGFGLTSYLDGRVLKLGKKDFVLTKNYDNEQAANHTKCYLKHGDDEILFLFRDTLKPDAFTTIASLKALNKKIILLSGDNKNIVEEIAKTLDINEFYFEKTPLQKLEFLKSLKLENKKIMMFGDGINDAPSLSLADISVSFCDSSGIAQSCADIVLWAPGLNPILEIFSSTKRFMTTIKENLWIALLYNLIAIPFAVMGFVTPLISAISMSLSSILVLLNSLRILK